MKSICQTLSLVFLMTILLIRVHAQTTSHFTDAYDELLKQRALYSFPTEEWDSLRCVMYGECEVKMQSTGNLRLACPLTKRLFGWHMIGVSSSSYVWQSLSDLSYFSYDINPTTGNAINATQIANWASDATVVAAHNNGVNVNLCVTLFNTSNEFSTFFGNTSAQTTCRNNLVNAVVAANAKGINIDFEGSGLTSTYLSQFTSFMSSLSSQLHNTVPNSELSVDLMGSYSGSSSLINQLNPFVDLFVIMGYDYYWGGQTTPGPVAPLYNYYSGGFGSVSSDLNNFLKIVPPSKIILGMPYYGRRWGVTNGCTLPGIGTGSSAISTQTYTQYKQNSNGYYSNPQRETYTFNAYNCFTDVNSIPNQQFIDDVYSFQKKYEVIKERGIAGAAVWRLGYDAGYSDLWNLINDNLSSCAFQACTDTIYDMGGPFGNYHNTEDYTFTIAPSGASSVTLTFLSFNLENGFDYLTVFNGPTTGSPQIANLTGTSLPAVITANSGVMTIQFHSDGATTRPGFEAVYSCSTGNPCTDNYEPNDNTTTAHTLFSTPLGTSPQNTTVNSYIFSGSDQDWYRIDNTGVNGTLVLTLSNLPANYDAELYDNGGLCGNCFIAGGYNSGTTSEHISFNFTTASAHQPPFYLKIYPNNSSQFDQCNPYIIDASWTPASTCNTPATPVANFGTSTCPGTDLYATNFSLYWTSSGSVYYDYVIAEYPYGNGNVVASQNCLNGTSAAVTSPNILPGKLYSWQVRATTDCDACNSSFSSPSYFHVAPSISPSGVVYVCDGSGTTLSTPAVNVPSPGIVSYQWYIDGNPIVGATANTYYATQNGTYYVKNTYSGSAVCSGSSTTVQSHNVYLTISATPSAPILSTNSPVCEGSTLTLSAVYQSGSAYHWTGPNGFNSTNTAIVLPTVSSVVAGTYYCYTTHAGCQSPTATIDVLVNPAPTASFSFSVSGDTVAFVNTSTNASSYSWNFGDAQTSTQTSPSHIYVTDNYYTVCLSASSSSCNASTNCQQVVIGNGISGTSADAFTKIYWEQPTQRQYTAVDVVQSTVDSGFICIGSLDDTGSVSSYGQYFKVDKNGNVVWARELPGNFTFVSHNIVHSPNGYVLCFTYNSTYLNVLMEIDEQGNKLWGKTYTDNNYAIIDKLCRIPSGGYLAYGRAAGDVRVVIKFDDNGTIVWQTAFLYTVYAQTMFNFNSMMQTTDGGFVLLGDVFDQAGGGSTRDALLVKLDAAGNHQWSRQIGMSSVFDMGDGIHENANGELILGGMTTGYGGWVIKLSSSGTYVNGSYVPTTSLVSSIFEMANGHYGALFGNRITELDTNFTVLSAKFITTQTISAVCPTLDDNVLIAGSYLDNQGKYRYQLIKSGINLNNCVDSAITLVSQAISLPTSSLSPTVSMPMLSASVYTGNPYLVTLVDSNFCHLCNLTAIISPSGNTTFCSGGSVTLNADSDMVSYLWSTGETTASITVTTPGNYTVTEVDSFGCSAISQGVTVVVNPLPVSDAGSDVAVCLGGSVSIGTTATGGNAYRWSPMSNLSNPSVSNPNASPTTTTMYYLTTTTTYGCSSIDSVVVIVNPLPQVDAGTDVTIVQGNSTIIGGSPTASGNSPFIYNWLPPVDLNSNTVSNPIASPSNTATYTVHVTDANNCISSDSITVTVIPVGCSYSLSDSSHTFTNVGGVYVFSVSTSNTGCTWLTSNASPWFTVQPSTLQTGNGSVTITADSCSGGGSRTDIFTVAGISYTVTQDCSGVGVGELDHTNNFVLYPNPTNDQFTLEINGINNDNCTMALFNAFGQVLMTKQIELTNGTMRMLVDLKNQTSGVYLVTVSLSNIMKILKVQKF